MTTVAKLSNFSTGPYNGRDKLAKVMQFAAKAVAYQMMIGDPKSAVAAKLVLFDKQIAMARKGLRLGKSIELYQKLQLVMTKDMPQFDFALEVISNVGMMFRWAYDNLSFFEKAKIMEKRDYGVTSNRYRVLATVAYLIIAVKKFLAANDAIAKANKAGDKEKLAAANKAQVDAVLEFVARVADMVNALHSSKWYQTNEGIQGIAGVVSAGINMRKVWIATKG